MHTLPAPLVPIFSRLEGNPHSEVYRLLDSCVKTHSQLMKNGFRYSSQLTPENLALLGKHIAKNNNLIPLIVADYYQHLKEVERGEKNNPDIALALKKIPKTATGAERKKLEKQAISRVQKGIAENGLIFWSRLARASNWDLGTKIEDFVFKILKPKDYAKTKSTLPDPEFGEEKLAQLESSLKKILENNRIPARISSRHKGAYSTYQNIEKGRNKKDLLGLRVVIDENNLKKLHSTKELVRQELSKMPGITFLEKSSKEFLGQDSRKGYEAVHDRYLAKEKGMPLIPFEIQFRTPQMHLKAEIIYAHHAHYKPFKDEGLVSWYSGKNCEKLEQPLKEILNTAHRQTQKSEPREIRQRIALSAHPSARHMQ